MSDWIIYHIQHSDDAALGKARDLLRRIRSRQLYKFVGEVIDKEKKETSSSSSSSSSNGHEEEATNVAADSLIQKKKKKKNKAARELEVAKQIAFHCNEIQRLNSSSSLPPNSAHEDGGISHTVIAEEDILVCVVEIGYGKGDENPVNFTHFYATDRRRTSSTSYSSTSTSLSGEGEVQVGIIPSEKVSTMVPAAFSERWCRVWCRDSSKLPLLKQGFSKWIEEDMGQNSSSFLLSASASPASSTHSALQGDRVDDVNPTVKKKLKM
jgi:hypothetical protein